jgi:3-dehydroquinate synthase
MVAKQPTSTNDSRNSGPDRLHRLQVSLTDASYPILIGTDWFGRVAPQICQIADDMTHALVICDAVIAATFGDEIRHGLSHHGVRTDMYIVPSGEKSKSSAQLGRLWDWMLASRADRRSVMIAVGGGVVGDLAGFAAATYQRGIRLVQIPTTLLSQVDSSVGGKTGINLPGGKNMVGAFWQPIMVAIDTDTLNSLPRREYTSGFAEVVKYGVIQRPDLFEWLETESDSLLKRSPTALVHAISESCQTKADVVCEDQRETTGRRAVLNYGHTFAHAIEATAGYGTFLHGEAVAIGMQMAAGLAVKRGLIDASVAERQTRLLRAFGLPVRWSGADPKAMLASMMNDKKNEHGKLRLILPTSLGSVAMFADADQAEVVAAIERCGDESTGQAERPS